MGTFPGGNFTGWEFFRDSSYPDISDFFSVNTYINLAKNEELALIVKYQTWKIYSKSAPVKLEQGILLQ